MGSSPQEPFNSKIEIQTITRKKPSPDRKRSQVNSTSCQLIAFTAQLYRDAGTSSWVPEHSSSFLDVYATSSCEILQIKCQNQILRWIFSTKLEEAFLVLVRVRNEKSRTVLQEC